MDLSSFNPFSGDLTGEDSLLGEAAESVLYWFRSPGSGDEHYDIWEDFPAFNEGWVKIQNRLDRYESPKVPTIYEDHKYIMKQNMDMSRPEEYFYAENLDDGGFESKMFAEDGLPSGRGNYRIYTHFKTKYPPSGENNFCGVDVFTETKIKYSVPGGVTSIPRFIAYPLNRMFKFFFVRYMAEEIVEKDGEYALERTREYNNYIRKYMGEEPLQSKTRRAEYSPMPDQGVFFQ